MSSRTRISVAIAIAMVALTGLFLLARAQNVIATATGWIVFLIFLPVMIDLYRRRKK